MSFSLAPCTKELRAYGLRALTFRFKRNPMDFDCAARPDRTLGKCYRLGRSDLGSRPWLFVECDDSDEQYDLINKIAARYHVRFTTFAAPATSTR
jgi:hypothetical protein